ncbi:MAG: sulfite exporter TauE/SafE family protein [Flavobacteriales bacterium]|nr:sulfite exporter TauE/SafE family protein [Flavobacteriales bacterium]MBL4734082.1 sulfite exporter TauE/SafE family protein [Flavobacteriales bacterium]
MYEYLGYAGAIVVGLLVVLIGAGGSILTVPVLVYLFHISPVIATGYALLIVGTTSIISTLSYIRRQLVNYRIAVIFGIPSVLAVYLTRRYMLPAIPDEMFTIGDTLITKDSFLMLLMGCLIFVSATTMVLVKRKYDTTDEPDLNTFYYTRMILIEGLIIGVLTGLVGTGGGFMIIPALVIMCNQPIKTAIGTALLIASAKSGIGFLGEMSTNSNIDYELIFKFTGFALVGIAIGTYLSDKISGYKLRNYFGYFLYLVGVIILIKEIFSL